MASTSGKLRMLMRRLLAVLTVATVVVASPVPVRVQSSPAPEKLGKVHFENSCNAAVAGDFDRAMALLHSFEFSAAIAGFEQALKGDPECGIAAWGVAMSVWGNPFSGLRAPRVIQDGQVAADRAQTIGAKTAREREYIDAVALLYRNANVNDQRTRTMAYEQEMEKIATKYPRRSRGRRVLCPGARSECAADRQDIRKSTEGGRDSRAALQDRARSPGHHALSDS